MLGMLPIIGAFSGLLGGKGGKSTPEDPLENLKQFQNEQAWIQTNNSKELMRNEVKSANTKGIMDLANKQISAVIQTVKGISWN